MKSNPSHQPVSLPPLFAQVRDCAAEKVRWTCTVERGFLRLHALRVRNLEIRAPNRRPVKKRLEN